MDSLLLLPLFLFLESEKETGSHRVAQVGLELLSSSDPPTLASLSARITGMSHLDLSVQFIFFSLHSLVYFFLSFLNCILALGVHVKNMQDCCVGTHAAA